MFLCLDIPMPGMIPCSRGTSGSLGLTKICLSLLSGEFCLTMFSYMAVPKSSVKALLSKQRLLCR